MKLQPAHKKILEYLEEYGSANTFKLSRDLKIEREELISLVKKLTKEGLIKFRFGTVIRGDKPAADKKIIEMSEIALGTISCASSQSTPAISEHAQMSKKPCFFEHSQKSSIFDEPKVFDSEEKKPVSKPIVILKKPKKPRILRDKQSGLEKCKERTRKLEDNWLKKEEGLKKDIEDLQTLRGKTAQKLSKEKALVCQIRKEKRELEKSLAVWESSLKQREESVQRKEEGIQNREESVSVAEKRLEREKQRIAKARALKKGINKLEATLGDLEKKDSIKKEESKQPKEETAKPKAVSKRIKKPKRKKLMQRKEKHKLEKIEEPKLEEQGYEKRWSEEERIEDTPISAFENVLETKPTEHLKPAISGPLRQELEKESFPSLRPDDFEEPEQIKPTLKSKIKGIIGKIRVSKTETEKPKISPEELWQPTEISKEKVEDKFHDLIEEEISLLKQKRNGEARNIHSQIKDMINEVIDPDQRKAIIKYWNRVKDFY